MSTANIESSAAVNGQISPSVAAYNIPALTLRFYSFLKISLKMILYSNRTSYAANSQSVGAAVNTEFFAVLPAFRTGTPISHL